VTEPCSWCGREVTDGDGFRAYEPAGARRAAFCRLEHVAAWALRGAHWQAGEAEEDDKVDECAFCGKPLEEAHVVLVRLRGEHRIPDGFCGVTHLLEWAKAGGRYAL
jgi:ribosomal protein L24E